MLIELHYSDTNVTEEQIQYAFVVDADLAQVGGGSTATVDY